MTTDSTLIGLKLNAAKAKLKALVEANAIEVSSHAVRDNLDRGYDFAEVIEMVKRGGRMEDTEEYRGERFKL